MDSEVLIEYLLSICISSCLKALRHLAPSHFGFQVQPRNYRPQTCETESSSLRQQFSVQPIQFRLRGFLASIHVGHSLIQAGLKNAILRPVQVGNEDRHFQPLFEAYPSD